MGLTTASDTTREQLQQLLEEQAALRRVATVVAGDPEPATVFERVCAEVASLFGVESTNLIRFEGDDTATVTGHWPLESDLVLNTGEEVPLEGETSTVKVSRSGRPERVDEYPQKVSGSLEERIRAAGIESSIAAPITVAGQLWGTLVASSGHPHSFAPGAENRLASFAELVADALANTDAREKLQRLLDEQAALRRVATLVASDPQPTEVFECVCEELGIGLGGEATNLMRFEADGTQTFVAAWNPPGKEIALPVGAVFPLEGDTALPRMLRSGEAQRIDDYSGFGGARAEMIRAAGIASAVTAPIKVAGRLWGALGAVSGSTFGFPPRTEERMASFAKLVALVLANTDAREQLQRLLDEQAALRRVAVLVASGPDPKAVFQRVSEEVGGLLGARRASLVRFEGPDRARIFGSGGSPEAPAPDGAEFPLEPETAAGKVSRSGRPERGDDYTRLRGDLGDQLREVGIASAIAAPVTVGGKLWGAVVAGGERPRAFPPGEEHRLAGFAELVADAVASADARERLHRLHDEQAALRRVATLVAREPEPAEIFERVCEEVGTVLGIDGTNLTRFEGDGTQTVLAGWSAPGVPVFPVGGGVPLTGDAAVPKVSRSGRPERVDDYAEIDGELAERIRSVGIASSVAAPITVGGELWGAIVATTAQPGAFPAYTEQRVASFAELVAHALANVDARQKLAASRARIVEAADSERRRLERNLHDGAQQRLVSLALALRLARADVDRDPDAARRRLKDADAQLAQALDELRELARGIHPAVLTDRGLAAALESLAATAPLPVELGDMPAPGLPPAIEAATYYLVAEGVANAAKHARASVVIVRVGRDERQARIEVRDDGVGGASSPSAGGLSGLADRVEALGGRLEIVSPPARGTSLVAEIPLATGTSG